VKGNEQEDAETKCPGVGFESVFAHEAPQPCNNAAVKTAREGIVHTIYRLR